MRRREFITLFGGAAAWPLAARAQPARKIPRIGVLWHAGSAEEEGSNFKALVKGFTDLGYVEGRTAILEHRFPNEVPERFRSMAAELVASGVDVLIAVGANAAPYAKNATTTIPVVFVLVSDPIGSGLVKSLARPEGNVTGISNYAADLIGKRLELFKEIVPGLSRVALLVNSNAQISSVYIDVFKAATANLGLFGGTYPWRLPDELVPAFDAMKQGVQALITCPDGAAFTYRNLISRLAIERRLPLSTWSRETLRAGALMSYGADGDAICQRAAVYVDKILKGAKPSELPVEQPTKFELLINLKTVKAIDLDVPPVLLARADEVIE
ncbi:MAG TPA: ABC transporter substrate-binding protein [Xanthobacteraceae bacterium]